MPINQPSASIKLTNVSIVRMKKGGKRFEIACYKNKVGEYRSGVEKDVDEVLQISQVFTNVSKGQAAPTADLQKAFNTTDTTEIVKQILTKGELQVGEKEREAKLGNLWKEVAGMVAERVVDPSTKRPYSVSLIEKAMSDIHFNVKADKPAKIQALECIKALMQSSPLPIQKAEMKIRITMPPKDGKRLAEQVRGLSSPGGIEEDEMSGEEWEVIMRIPPENFRLLTDLLEKETKGKGRVESMGWAVVNKEERFE